VDHHGVGGITLATQAVVELDVVVEVEGRAPPKDVVRRRLLEVEAMSGRIMNNEHLPVGVTDGEAAAGTAIYEVIDRDFLPVG
jgi:hypothetical protein